ncbi:MAG: Nif3-like dinuclear metal center hexameric protein [Deltaproteobacteria bacterium]|jgi:dinuclear metal center YbgI/SA1388 family protein|nr:Nif3-like dinuclear metal center hexameric protein [Deltaproteobacteria bacterium]
MKLTDIISIIEKTAPPAIAAPWDDSGMQVAARRATVSHLALMLDPTPQSVEKALALGADCLLAHHPLSIKPRLPKTLDDFHAVLRLLFTHDVPLYSAHTSLDANLHGPAAWLAEAFGLTERRALEAAAGHPANQPANQLANQPDGEPHYGFGIVGLLPEPLPYAVFADRLAALLGKSSWRASGPKPATVVRMAYCPGAGESLVRKAAALGADVHITGDVKYHTALEAPIRMLDVGHFILEETMMLAFAGILRAACAPVPVTFVEAADPFACEGAA